MTVTRRRFRRWNLAVLLGLLGAWGALLAIPSAGAQGGSVPEEFWGTYEGAMANSTNQPADPNTVRVTVNETTSSGSIDFLFGGAGLFCTGVTWEWDTAYASVQPQGATVRGSGTYRNEPCQSFTPQPQEFELNLLLGGGTVTGQLYGEDGFIGGFDVALVGATPETGGDGGDDAEDPPIIAVVGGIAAVTAAAAAASGIDPETGQPADEDKPKREVSIVQVSADLLDVAQDAPAQLTLTGWHSSETGLARVPMDLWIELPLLAKGLKVTPTSGTGELEASLDFDPETFDENETEIKLVAHGSWNGHEATKDVTVRLGADYLLEWFS